MNVTLSPFTEQYALSKVRRAQRDENVKTISVKLVRVAGRWAFNLCISLAVSYIERKNHRLQAHIDWFQAKRPELLMQVRQSNAQAGPELLEGTAQFSERIGLDARLLDELAVDLTRLEARQDLVEAIRKSVQILKEMEQAVSDFHAAGLGRGELPSPKGIVTDAKLISDHGRTLKLAADLRDGSIEFDAELLEIAKEVLDNRTPEANKRPEWARELVAGS